LIRKNIIACLLLFSVLSSASSAQQHWKFIFKLPTLGSSASFYSPDVGCIGTGNYPGGYPAQIYYTTDGGRTWTRSLMPNMVLFGQVTDIYYADRWTVWATVREKTEHGWSGLYKSIDGGKTWRLWFQVVFPVSVRQTPNGLIYYTDRYSGVSVSTDGGYTFGLVAPSGGSLGLDFLDNNNGIESSEGLPGPGGAPTYIFTNGITWTPYDIPHEAWTAFADIATKQFFIASERDDNFPGTNSGVFSTSDNGKTFLTRWTSDGDAITGGIAGAKWCRSIIYVQGQGSHINKNGVQGLMRSTDGGITWIKIGGPSNYNDKRFAVTGKGAVVYAFDSSGGVWKTTDGGDGTISASALGFVSLVPLSPVLLAAKLCDSAEYSIGLRYSDCDSLIVSRVSFLDDTIGELTTPNAPKYFGKNNVTDTLVIRLNPKIIHAAFTEKIRITLRQPDGTTQDTIFTILVQGLAPPDEPIIAEAGASGMIDFGTGSICGGDSVRTITVINSGCAPISIASLITDGPPFILLSSFQPFTLDPGISRQVLVEFKPSTIGALTGKLTLMTANATFITTLTASGKAGERGYSLSQPFLTSTICDSAEANITLKNTSCSPVRIDSIGIDLPFRLDPFFLPATLITDSSITLHVHFIPKSAGQITGTITIHSVNDANVTQVFDTTLTLTAFATAGLPDISISPATLDFGSINTCIYKDLEITLTNTGCDTLKIADEIFNLPITEYTIIQSIKGADILRGDSAKIIIRFKTTASGNYNVILHLVTNAGGHDISLTGSGSNDPGSLILTTTSVGAVLTCRDSVFHLTLSNTTCDSLTLDSIVFIGSGSSDYSATNSSGTVLDPGKIISINGIFSPRSGGARNAVAHVYLHLLDKTKKEITVTMDGIGIAPAPIRISIPNIRLNSSTEQKISLPIQVLDGSVVPVSSIIFSMNVNTNLIEPKFTQAIGTALPVMTNTSFTVTLTLSPPALLIPGLLGTLDFIPYVTDTLYTDIALTGFKVFGPGNDTDCLPMGALPQTETSFSLTTQCGDSSLSKYMKYGIAGIGIESIVPNPSSSRISVTLLIPSDYQNDGIIEIFDALGNTIQSERLLVSEKEQKVIRTVDLQGTSGLRILRIKSPLGICSENFYLLK